ncbi:hypothetical protein Mal15_01270 [Stieleria maiorica]|uniref:Uncharacterized protein n=1 Tax=Stieleria maiorica TaxID=2795974 RepID=A0A5B9M4P2_9BACT|nr:hypothetical protein [Stieleria maiorica]QEF96101.1 hypothetical protein Mal15_01270 [Stieleria maiorica]
MCRPDSRSLWLIALTAGGWWFGSATCQDPTPAALHDVASSHKPAAVVIPDGAVPHDELVGLVAGLGSESFATRHRAESKLIGYAIGDQSVAEQVKALLRDNPFPPQDIECYLSKRRLLNRLEMRERDLLMERFLYDPAFDRSSLPGWEQFRQCAGDTHDARLVFRCAVEDRLGIGRLLADGPTEAVRLTELETLDRHDSAGWSVALTLACRQQRTVADPQTVRLVALLRHPGTGPAPWREHEQRVLSRIIASLLTSTPIDLRDRLVIGLRYGCDDVVESDCRSTLNDPDESPSRIVAALLAASKLDFAPTEIDQWITSYSGDDRVSHVWRSMMPPKTTHRTQVRDVALALKLHRAGIDPRTRGFDALAADPILVFRPYSLGFETESSRRRTHANP